MAIIKTSNEIRKKVFKISFLNKTLFFGVYEKLVSSLNGFPHKIMTEAN